ncbi:MAG: aspartate 1-decarboxylase [Planctomycetes bacterium GWF2_50_10]|nr:MAG: aspartate 1-decarboxylase [Planctomycetes bacterium GWF2_50_10]
MFVKALKCKIHRATVTDTKIEYSGSIAVDPELMEAAGMAPYEAVLIADVNNGNRFETYVVPAKRGSGDIIIMGAAARLAQCGDRVIIINFGYFTPEELKNHKPKVVVMGDNNKISEIV